MPVTPQAESIVLHVPAPFLSPAAVLCIVSTPLATLIGILPVSGKHEVEEYKPLLGIPNPADSMSLNRGHTTFVTSLSAFVIFLATVVVFNNVTYWDIIAAMTIPNIPMTTRSSMRVVPLFLNVRFIIQSCMPYQSKARHF